MSGKTTFLRTIGINLVLAYAGGPVLADSFKCSLMKIYTSMRLEDDISGISTFYAELLRIKEIVEANHRGERMIALIDEIFKGTNSKDRIYGATETVKQLATPNIFTFITTHDFELCELEHQVPCTNYHFSEYYENNKIVGIDAEMAQAVADKLGMELEILDMDFDAIINAVQSGKADIGVAGMTVNEERLQSIDFSDTYAKAKQVIIVRSK